MNADYIIKNLSKQGIAHERNGRENEDRTTTFQTDEYIWLGVFDGVSEGGGGAVAASVASESMNAVLTGSSFDSVLDAGFAIFRRAHASILEMNMVHPEYGKMRTTGAVACIDRKNHSLRWFSIGDSAIYLFRKHRKLQKLTIEDTDIGILLAQGKISHKAASRATIGHELNRWLGMNVHPDAIDNYVRTGYIELHKQDSILLCTDGLYSKLSFKQLSRLISNEADPEILIKSAIQSGSEDDISLIHAIPDIKPSSTLISLKLVLASMILMFACGFFSGTYVHYRMKENTGEMRHILREGEKSEESTDSLTIFKTEGNEGI